MNKIELEYVSLALEDENIWELSEGEILCKVICWFREPKFVYYNKVSELEVDEIEKLVSEYLHNHTDYYKEKEPN